MKNSKTVSAPAREKYSRVIVTSPAPRSIALEMITEAAEEHEMPFSLEGRLLPCDHTDYEAFFIYVTEYELEELITISEYAELIIWDGTPEAGGKILK